METGMIASGQLRYRLRQQAAVAELGQLALANRDLERIVREACALAAADLEVEFSQVLELLPDGRGLLLRAGVGWRNGLVGHEVVGAEADSPAGYTLKNRASVGVSGLRQEKRFTLPPLLKSHGVTSGISVIVYGAEKDFGVMGAYTAHRREFNVEDANFLQAVANIVGAAVERIAAEQELARVRDNYKDFFDKSPFGISRTAPDRRLLAVNSAMAAIGGFASPEEMMAEVTDMYRFYAHPAEREAIWAEIAAMGELKNRVIEVRRRDGSHLWIALSGRLVRDAQGNILYFESVMQDITEQKLAEDRLRKSEELFRVITLLNPDHVLMQDRELKYEFVLNPQLGLTEQEMIGKTDYELASREEADELTRIKTGVLRTGKSVHAEVTLVDKLGERQYFDGNYVPNYDAHGRIAGLIGYFRNVTEHKLTEGELSASELRFRATFEQAAVGIAHVAPDGRWLQINQKLCDIVGYRREELLAKTFQEITYPGDLEADLELRRRLLAGEIGSYSREKRYLNKDGSLVWVNLTVSLARREDGEPDYLIVVVEDISRRKRADEALLESEEKYRSLFADSKDMVFVGDAGGGFIDVNAAAVEMLGYGSAEELKAESMQDLYTEPAEAASYLEELGRKGYVRNYELGLKSKDGRRIEASVTTSIKRDRAGNIAGYQGIVRDLTAQRLLQKQLIESQKMESVGRLAGGVAHDFNNYLTAIEGYIDLAMMQSGVESEVGQELAAARAAGERAANLARQLLLFSRREALELRPVDLNRLVQGMLKLLAGPLGEQFALNQELWRGPLIINADPGHIEQVLMNLALNARDAMPAGGPVTVRTEVTAGARRAEGKPAAPRPLAKLTVSDRGVGMDADTISHIFEPFFTGKGGEGTGLGLSVAYGIVEQHGGWIEVDSTPGTGSAFAVFLPLLEKADEAVPRTEERCEVVRGRGEKILLVEDEDSVRDMVAAMLVGNNYELVAVADAEAAHAAFAERQGDFDLVFSDVVLPGEDGLSLVEGLLQEKPGLKAILASGYTDAQMTAAIYGKGYNFLQKPYTLLALTQAIDEALGEND